MKKRLFILFAFNSVVWAEANPLPPVIDNSTQFSGSTGNPAMASNNAIYEVLGRVEQLQQELQQLRGIVEEQAHVIEHLQSRQSNIYTDLDQRVSELTRQLQGTQIGTDAAVSATLATVTEPQQQESSETASNNETIEPQLDQQALYREAYELLRNGHNNQAIKAFTALIEQFPNGEYADNAQYWLGEANKVNQNITAAETAFTQLIKQFPQSDKVPDALLKLGYIELERNNNAKARDYLTRVAVDYPGTTAAHLAGKKLDQMENH